MASSWIAHQDDIIIINSSYVNQHIFPSWAQNHLHIHPIPPKPCFWISDWSLPESVSMSTSISVSGLELGLRLSLYPSPEVRTVMCDEGGAEDDGAGLKNLNNVCCRGSTVSGIGSGSDSAFSVPFSGSIQGSETGRCWAVNSQRSVFSSKPPLLATLF